MSSVWSEGEANWQRTPVVVLSPYRAEMVLNDVWRFEPSRGAALDAPSGVWGTIRVPGIWEKGAWNAARLEGLQSQGKGGGWEGLVVETTQGSLPIRQVKGVDRAWLEREVEVPADWAGRRVVLELQRVATDARVYLNGQPCGEVTWPSGEVDVTAAIRPGERNTLRLLVVAAGDGREVLQYMDAHIALRHKATLKNRGVLGDAALRSEPPGGRLAGVFAQPSVRRKELGLVLELENLKGGGSAALRVRAFDAEGGELEQEWELGVALPSPDASGEAALSVVLPWEDPRLWEVGEPNLYRLSVSLQGEGMEDEQVIRFGFREFWIEGRQYMLNGRVFNARMHLQDSNIQVREIIANHLRGWMRFNVNLMELWPDAVLQRGNQDDRALIASVADELGLPLMVGVSDPTGMFDPSEALKVGPERFEEWRKVMRREWKRLRNSPSVLVLLVAGNRFAHADDQNPLRIGNRKNLEFTAAWRAGQAEPGWALIRAVKALDPTRPVTSHHNANVGEIHTSNNYLNLLALQEREDWLSFWVRDGDMPYAAVEFDPPFAATMTRGRRGWTGGSTTEPLLTEFLAIYQGVQAYTEEPAAYRAMIARTHKAGQEYEGVSIPSAATFRPFAAWWMSRTLRAWRGYGLSGGMIHWEDFYGTRESADAREFHRFADFVPGTRGGYLSQAQRRLVFGTLPEAAEWTETGHALAEGYEPLQAWIAGPPGAFTRQDHVFLPGEKVVKSAALLNDSLQEQAFALTWRLLNGEELLAEGAAEGVVPVGVPHFEPITFEAPAVASVTDLRLELTATIGEREMRDSFALRVRLPVQPVEARVYAWDPEGASSAWLREAGAELDSVLPADFANLKEGVLLIGRNALPTADLSAWPAAKAALERFVAGGGRVLLMAQDPEWLRGHSGLRVARPVGRRFWPVPTQVELPLLQGLDGEDFRDWRGAGSLRDPAETLDLTRPVPVVPRWGWHLNNTGSVSSAAWEKPHVGRWTPLLEGEFDLAYSPLMEWRMGRGLMVYCGLDVEERSEADPVAREMGARLLAYLASDLETVPLGRAAYLGGAQSRRALESMGLAFDVVNSIPKEGLLVVGEDAAVSDEDLWRFVERGGRLLLLGGAAKRLGGALERRRVEGVLPLPEGQFFRGISHSDLRLRVAVEAELLPEDVMTQEPLGEGWMVRVPLLPSMLNAGEKSSLRYTEWRLTRALAQVLTNLGGGFRSDMEFLDFKGDGSQPVSLAGEWGAKAELLLPAVKDLGQAPADPGRADFTRGWELPAAESGDWVRVELPVEMEKAHEDFADKDGAVWFRREFEVPEAWLDQRVVLSLGRLDDFDDVWVNGARVGGVRDNPNAWDIRREYRLRPGVLEPGRNVVVVRVWDRFGGGGFTDKDSALLHLRLLTPPVRPSPYVPGFRQDHELGDDPARYYRW